jgi:predicted Zn-dependent protease
MKKAAIALAFVLFASPAYAQLGRVVGGLNKAKETKDKVDDLHMSEREERQLGEKISALLTDRFGVMQDAAVTKYVTLVGRVLAQASTRPNLQWEFIVLDTDGVNAYAAPGGFIHITRGMLGLIRNEAELAGVLGHEITHVTEAHTKNAIVKANRTKFAAQTGTQAAGAGGWTAEAINILADYGYNMLYENRYDRKDEIESDTVGTALANAVGYAPLGMTSVLKKIAERNSGMKEPNGLFASHPQTEDRIKEMDKKIKKDKLAATALVQARYAKNITFDAAPPTAIAMNVAGAKGAVGDTAAPKEQKKEEPKKGNPLSALTKSGGSSSQSSQTVASGGSRGGVPDRDAVGGPNKSKLRVTITPAELDAFKKGIAG